MPERMHLSAPASAANLGPGFDCLGVALDLRNEVTIGPSQGGGVEIEIEGEGVRAASRSTDNLFVRAFRSAGHSHRSRMAAGPSAPVHASVTPPRIAAATLSGWPSMATARGSGSASWPDHARPAATPAEIVAALEPRPR